VPVRDRRGRAPVGHRHPDCTPARSKCRASRSRAPPVNIAARVMALASDGRVFVSGTVKGSRRGVGHRVLRPRVAPAQGRARRMAPPRGHASRLTLADGWALAGWDGVDESNVRSV
jgi:hypothetical protein